MEWFAPDYVWPIVGSITAGALIGFERQYRGAPAGFRTHILVALASGLLMLAAVHQIRWLSDTPLEIIRIDPVRMAHGILTGIGFLGAGVIFREGFSVRGLTTAASLWITSALGTLYGIGFYGLAIGGTVATIAVLGAVTLTESLLPQRAYLDIRARYRRSERVTEAEFREILLQHGLKALSVSTSIDDDIIAFEATCQCHGAPKTEALTNAFADNQVVQGFSISRHV
ncbi:MgtC/SapB family protein [Brevundimonas sp. UBA2416]|uniref:MgtC/SapB family protein n=1 Tax=Brevundimonas sp. UBA2416 TaxID=1946124 RepID=UPI0025C04A28|nr:MgtC/SapB family protein [Brevundimonas sp. UBA2416]